MPFTAEHLNRFIQNDPKLQAQVYRYSKWLREAVDRAAEQCTRNNQEWHDDPAADDYADYHAPAVEQFPRPIRDAAARQLVRYYLTEFALQDEREAQPCTQPD